MPDPGPDRFLIALALISMGIQLAAAAQALRLIRVTAHRPAWVFIALACCIQALRRGVTLAGLLMHGGDYPTGPEDQFLGLAISVCMFAGVSLIAPIFHALRRAELDLRAALEHITLFSGLLPICSYCKRIRNGQGGWEQVETYIREHTAAEFSHGICPDCLEKVMREMDEAGNGGGGADASSDVR